MTRLEKHEQIESAVLEHIRQHGATTIRSADRAVMAGLAKSTFDMVIQSFVLTGVIRADRGLHGNKFTIIGPTVATLARDVRASCPRCETVNCQRHTASHLTTGRISPVYR